MKFEMKSALNAVPVWAGASVAALNFRLQTLEFSILR
jgi:hypothetical protein